MKDADVRTIVTETMNILEHVYGVEELESYGSPTITEITERIMDEHFSVPKTRNL